MTWDINSFLDKFRGGFDAGEQKRAEEEKLMKEEQKVMLQDQKEAEKAQQLAEKTAKAEELHQFKIKKEQLTLIEKLAKLFGMDQKETKTADGEPSPTPTPNPMIEALKKGFADYSAKSNFENPLATMSAEMASAAEKNPLPDPYLPATMSLMETGGGKNMKYENNPFNYGGDKPDLNTAIDKIYQGIGSTAGVGTTDGNGMGGKYRDYLNSGDLQDFFKVYTPSADPRNPNYDELMKRYTQLRGYFPE